MSNAKLTRETIRVVKAASILAATLKSFFHRDGGRVKIYRRAKGRRNAA
jgi:hypothetical protein